MFRERSLRAAPLRGRPRCASTAGLFLARFVEPGSSAPTIVFVLLTLVHVVANWLAVRGLQLRSLNTNRAEVVIDAYLDDGRVLSPAEAAAAESLWPSSGWWSLRVWAASLVRRGRPRPPRLEMGCRLTELPDASVVEAAASGTTPPPFVAAAMVVGAHSVVRIAVWQGAAPCDEFAAAFTVRFFARARGRVRVCGRCTVSHTHTHTRCCFCAHTHGAGGLSAPGAHAWRASVS